ncbi:hypothetical protein [Chlamydia sp. 17-3921]|uniref:hypothetical protein n=1 Tax=Chlamydia sp. 17-3921 TaxID=2675798 RepID=UPI00191910F8|nr:hypothetical protein [Chlamydia sp. 17-3921]
MVNSFFKKIFSPGPKFSVFSSFIIIALSSLICVPTLCWLFFPENIFTSKICDVPIKNLFLKSASLHKLPGIVFSELLELSANDPTFLKHFSVKHAEKTLREIGIFSSIVINKVPDNKGIAIFYSLKTPVAFVANQSNMLFDLKGSCFPCTPFFPPLNLPSVFFSEKDLATLELPKIKTALIMELIEELSFSNLKTIDLTAYDNFPGEIVVSLSSGDILRLPGEAFLSALQLYKIVRTDPSLIDLNSHYIYDLRFPNTLFLKKL